MVKSFPTFEFVLEIYLTIWLIWCAKHNWSKTIQLISTKYGKRETLFSAKQPSNKKAFWSPPLRHAESPHRVNKPWSGSHKAKYISVLLIQVAEKIQEELEDYRSREDEIKRMKSEMGIEGSENDAAIGLLNDNTQVRWKLLNQLWICK